MTLALATLRIQFEEDVVAARQRTREIAEALGCDLQHQTRVATAASEMARNAFSYAGGGTMEFFLEGNTAPQLFSIRVSDEGPGIRNLDQILEGSYRSQTGMGLGIIGTKRLLDQFKIQSERGKGTVVVLGKLLPRRAPLVTPESLPAVLEKIAALRPKSILSEFREQNQELLRTMDELRRRQDDLMALNRELEDTNRGVVALYAELDEKANHLRRADEMKSRFLSNMSHEFRTPLNSIQALSRLLLDRTDGELTSEQEIQVSYIRKSAESLSELVNDLLDSAKVEAGKIDVRPAEFEPANLFGALRGMLKPLLLANSLHLVFEDPVGVPPIYSDEAKVSQILRNFISNALKFTEAGEIRVSAVYENAGEAVLFRVEDTGIGIALEHQDEVFQDFTQVDSPLQRHVKGTGLGLPLSRKLAELLGGRVGVVSQLGQGSTFWLRIPLVFSFPEPALEGCSLTAASLDRDSILLVEDHYETLLAYEKYLRHTIWATVPARSVREVEAVLRRLTPVAIILDIRLGNEDVWDLLTRLKCDPATCHIPILVVTTLDDRAKALALGADDFLLKPASGEALRAAIEAVARHIRRTVLLVDHEEASRYLARQLFPARNIRFTEAANAAEALEKMSLDRPDIVLADISTPAGQESGTHDSAVEGLQLVEAMQSDPSLKDIPTVVLTSVPLSPQQSAYLARHVAAVLPKSDLLSSTTAATLQSVLSAAGLEDLSSAREFAQGSA